MHPNGELIHDGYEAFAKGDMTTVSELLDDDIVWHDPGSSVLSGEFRGKEAVLAQFGRLFEITQGTFRQEIHAILADDDHVVVMSSSTFDKPRPFTGTSVFVWHVSGGKATECWAIQTDQAAAAAALA